jgi:hypothetical protein
MGIIGSMRQSVNDIRIIYELYKNNLLFLRFKFNKNHRLFINGVENSLVNRTIAINGKTPRT